MNECIGHVIGKPHSPVTGLYIGETLLSLLADARVLTYSVESRSSRTNPQGELRGESEETLKVCVCVSVGRELSAQGLIHEYIYRLIIYICEIMSSPSQA